MEKYKMHEVNQFKFLQIPKELFKNKCYRCKLNSDAKLVYGLLLDRMHLSETNNWCNEKDEIYLIYTKEDIANILGIGERTVYNAFKELVECKLISQERQGVKLPNKIYIGKIDANFQVICKICRSKSANTAGQDMQNLQTNNTNLNNTDLNNTYEEEEVLKAYKEVKNRYLNTREKEVLKDLLKSYSKDLILKSIDIMVTDAEKITLKYIISTLEDWRTKGIETVEQVDKMRAEWQKTKIKPMPKEKKEKIIYNKKESTFNNFEQRTYDFEDLEKKLLGWQD